MIAYADTFQAFWVQIWGAVSSFPYQYMFQLFHDIILVMDVSFAALIIYSLIELIPYRPKFYKDPRKALTPEQKKIPTAKDPGVAARWKSIRAKAEAAPPQSLTLGIIEADSFVDDVLKKMGLPGEHMADRLERIDTGELETLDRLWTAHRARNNLVHTPGYVMNERDARRYMDDYEAFLTEISAI